MDEEGGLLELPHDWGATKRGSGPSVASTAIAAAPPHTSKTSHPHMEEETQSSSSSHDHKEKKGSEPKRFRKPDDAAPEPAAKNPPEDDPEHAKPAYHASASPLGPRSTFNAITHDAPERGQLKQMVLAQLGKSRPDPPPHQSPCMEVHCLLSKLPYQKMLSDLFMHQDREVLPSPNIPYVTRTYEESFMREPLNSSERLCAKQENCECMFLDKEQPFIAVEFLLPGERPPTTPHLCVVCCRAVTQQLYYDIMFDKQDFGGVIQRFGNIHSQPGEYALDAMLIAAPNVALHIMPLPIVSHQRNRYTVVVKRGIKHLKQSRVHFQCTPSC
jgi:hypothetical protein